MMQIQLRKEKTATLMTPRSEVGETGTVELDRESLPTLEASFLSVQPEEPFVIFDATWITFVDASILKYFTTMEHLLKERGGLLILLGANPPLRHLMKITKLDEIIPMVSSLEEAQTAIDNHGHS